MKAALLQRCSSEVIDFSKDAEWRDVFYREPDPKRVKDLARFLREDRNRWVRLYHGTAADIPVMDEGLLPTSATRRRSFQSASGYVYLSIYPSMAETFGKMGNPTKPTAVYAVTLTIRRLLPDKDQLNNQRAWAEREVGNSLAESLAFGHGARVKGKIDPYQIQRIK